VASSANFEDVKTRSQELKTSLGGQRAIFDAMERMYFMDDDENYGSRYPNTKLTLSPDGRNAAMGATRLLTSTDPQFKVDIEDREMGEAIERGCRRMWDGVGKIAGSPVHFDMVTSAIVYDRVHLAITSTADLVKVAAGRGPAHKARAEKLAKRTPFMFDVWNPRDCYPEYDRLGLSGHLRVVEVLAGDVRSAYGEKGLENYKATEPLTLNEWFDLDYHVVWVDGVSEPLLNVSHKLPFIPVVVASVYGSTGLFTKAEEQLQPFLYTLWKSGLWQRQNLAMTVMYTMMAKIGSNPIMVYHRNMPEKELTLDWDNPGGIVTLDAGESLAPLQRQTLDPSLLEGLKLADSRVSESTIYKQALGQNIGAASPYSSLALLSQAGRLPLVNPQRRVGWAIGQAMEIAWAWLAHDGKEFADVKGKSLPEDLEIVVNLDIDLPQDKLQMANVAQGLVGGGLASVEWVRENILNIGQSGKETERIWTERAQDAMTEAYVRDQIEAEARRKQEEAQMQQAQQMPPGGAGMAPGMPPGAGPTPDMGMPPGGAGMAPGMPPGMEGVPPEMAGMPPEMIAALMRGGGVPGTGGGMPPGMPPEGMV